MGQNKHSISNVMKFACTARNRQGGGDNHGKIKMGLVMNFVASAAEEVIRIPSVTCSGGTSSGIVVTIAMACSGASNTLEEIHEKSPLTSNSDFWNRELCVPSKKGVQGQFLGKCKTEIKSKRFSPPLAETAAQTTFESFVSSVASQPKQSLHHPIEKEFSFPFSPKKTFTGKIVQRRDGTEDGTHPRQSIQPGSFAVNKSTDHRR
ncbi:hypothetical protein NPIL_245931 [Nephila pilipes]|uniref:Uncharacterized protein n=1 Tax=Nephila pilipes TaxID=299642 RepID=A0A8X6IFK8_NEPPI|nr:hypothetical protein NPIL_245931 [Nephila pilipes]